MSSRIDQIVAAHVKKFKTNDPFEIAASNNIIVKYWLFNHEVFGMYRYERRNRFVFINRNISISQQIFTCGHEVYHALFHTRMNTMFLSRNTLYPVGKFEREASEYSTKLLLYGISENSDMTKENVCREYGIPYEMQEYM
ncbi:MULTISPECIES: ImmA/IrrE family metallo-endopeptidase [unclassified Sporolactobacillus]|uniref:ImmA/IrrE family metallo-endopeptidase n=1 Tax=unclassified Sporolactobacillus TaxID=2628533 RepID=UPI002368F169|nr:ImmA/IrrE family metallo-endopeptidase [Sporolactobacillus sp. CQH2019]MDD9150410.1 ImmA/IrrE family metallo-endopeptidase [Sporolactobacillus sp. CQH2019]